MRRRGASSLERILLAMIGYVLMAWGVFGYVSPAVMVLAIALIGLPVAGAWMRGHEEVASRQRECNRLVRGKRPADPEALRAAAIARAEAEFVAVDWLTPADYDRLERRVWEALNASPAELAPKPPPKPADSARVAQPKRALRDDTVPIAGQNRVGLSSGSVGLWQIPPHQLSEPPPGAKRQEFHAAVARKIQTERGQTAAKAYLADAGFEGEDAPYPPFEVEPEGWVDPGREERY